MPASISSWRGARQREGGGDRVKPCHPAVAASCAVLHYATVIAGNWFGLHHPQAAPSRLPWLRCGAMRCTRISPSVPRCRPEHCCGMRLPWRATTRCRSSSTLLPCDRTGTAVALAAPVATGLLVCSASPRQPTGLRTRLGATRMVGPMIEHITVACPGPFPRWRRSRPSSRDRLPLDSLHPPA